MITGGCLCGGVRYAIHGAVDEIQLCHCRSCRKAQGGPLASNVPVATRDFELIDGAERLRDYESSPGKHRLFCSVCGSPIISRHDEMHAISSEISASNPFLRVYDLFTCCSTQVCKFRSAKSGFVGLPVLVVDVLNCK